MFLECSKIFNDLKPNVLINLVLIKRKKCISAKYITAKYISAKYISQPIQYTPLKKKFTFLKSGSAKKYVGRGRGK